MNPTEVVYDYVEEIDPNLTCSICQSALVDPVTTTSCKHTFCRDCITTALQHNPQCPIDRSALTLHSLRDTEQLVKLMLDELKVQCAAEDCEEVMQRGLLLAHSRSCVKGMVKCDDPECGLSMIRQRLPHHRAYECFQRKMECGKCNVILTFKARTQHDHQGEGDERGVNEQCQQCGETVGTDRRLHNWTCPQAGVPCTHAARGCPAIVARATLSDHTQSCAFEALSSFFAINDARFAAVEERSKSLKHTVDALNVELGLVKTELGYARHSIEYLRKMIRDGWVGGLAALPTADESADSLDGHVPAPHASLPVGGIVPITSMDVAVTGSDTSTPRQDPPALPEGGPTSLHSPPPGPPAATTLAADPVIPAWAGITDRAAADIQARERPLIPAANLLDPTAVRRTRTFADQVFDRLPAGMPVDQAVRRLMRVSAQLAEGMDSMERRNEIRSMTDGLRLSEEVAGLRAIVNTMRIQVMMNHRSNSYRAMPIPSHPPSARSAPDGPLVETITTQHAPSPSTPPSSAPFSAYSAPGFFFPDRSPDTQPVPLHPDEDVTDPPTHGVRESVMFRARRLSMGSTSSLVSTGAGRTVGRPMGIPPPEGQLAGDAGVRRGSLRMRTNPISLLSRRLTLRENGPRL